MHNDNDKEEHELWNKYEPGNILNLCKHKYKEWNLEIHTDWGTTGEWNVEI